MTPPKSNNTYFNKPLKEATEKQKKGSWHGFSDNCYRPTQRYKLFGLLPPSPKGRWLWSKERAERAIQNYRLFEKTLKEKECTSFGGFAYNHPEMEFVKYNKGSPQYWITARDKIMCDTNWADIQAYSQLHAFDTEKSEPLLQRIINMGSNPGDILADFFCGSGTTLAVAEKLGRRWIGSDLSKFAIQVTRKRLLDIHNSKDLLAEKKKQYGKPARPFELWNIGNYETVYWQEKQDEYLAFMLKLYQSQPLTGFRYLHGRKGDRAVHVGPLNAPVTMEEVEKVVVECRANNFNKADVLGWE